MNAARLPQVPGGCRELVVPHAVEPVGLHEDGVFREARLVMVHDELPVSRAIRTLSHLPPDRAQRQVSGVKAEGWDPESRCDHRYTPDSKARFMQKQGPSGKTRWYAYTG